jgi:hypothetical protein
MGIIAPTRKIYEAYFKKKSTTYMWHSLAYTYYIEQWLLYVPPTLMLKCLKIYIYIYVLST